MPKCYKCDSIFAPGLLCAQGFCAECQPCVCTAIDCRNCRAGSSRASTRMLSDAPMEEVIETVPIGIATLKYLATFQCDRPNTCCPDNLCNSCWTREWAEALLDQRELLKSGRGVGGKPVFKQDTKDYTKVLEEGVLARLDTCIQRMEELLAHRLEVEATHAYLEHAWKEGCKKARSKTLAKVSCPTCPSLEDHSCGFDGSEDDSGYYCGIANRVLTRTNIGYRNTEDVLPDWCPRIKLRGHTKDCAMLDEASLYDLSECDPAYGEDPPAIDAAEKSLSDADASQLAADILQDQFEKHGENARAEAAITAMRIAYGSEEKKVTDKAESVPVDQLRCDIDIRGIAKQAAIDAIDAAEMQKVWNAVYGVDPTLLANVVIEPVAADLPVDDEEEPKVFTAWYRAGRNTGKFTAITHMGCSTCGRPLSEHIENKDGKFLCPVEKEGK